MDEDGEMGLTSLLLFALLVVLEAFSKLLVDGEIDSFVVGVSIFVEELCALGRGFFDRRDGLVLHLARHIGDGGWREKKQDSATDGNIEFGRVYRLLRADGNMQSRQSGEYAAEGKRV